MYRRFLKRVLDLLLSLIGILLTGIPMLIIAAVIRHEDPGPAVFRQKRFGIHRTFFTLYKFRSMKLSTPMMFRHICWKIPNSIS